MSRTGGCIGWRRCLALCRCVSRGSLRQLWPWRDRHQLAVILPIHTRARPTASTCFCFDAVSRRRWLAGAPPAGRSARAQRRCEAIRLRLASNCAPQPRSCLRLTRLRSPSPWTRHSSAAVATAAASGGSRWQCRDLQRWPAGVWRRGEGRYGDRRADSTVGRASIPG